MSDSKKELIEEHKRLTAVLKDGTPEERLKEYKRQKAELEELEEGKEYSPKLEKMETSNNGQWLIKSNYGPKGAKLYDPTVNQKRKATNTDTIEDIGPNKNVKEYTGAVTGTAQTQANTLSAKDAKRNKKQPVKTMADMSPEEIAEMENKYACDVNKAEAPPPHNKIEHARAFSPELSGQILSRIPESLRHIANIESSNGRNRNHEMVNAGIHKGTSSVSSFGLMPLFVKEVAQKYKPLGDSNVGKKILAASSPDAINKILKRESSDANVAHHVWNYNQSRLSRHTSDPEHLEALGVAAHRRGVSGALQIYKNSGIEGLNNDPYVAKYKELKNPPKVIKQPKQVAFRKSIDEKIAEVEAKLTLLRSELSKAILEKKQRLGKWYTPSDAEMFGHLVTSVDDKLAYEAKWNGTSRVDINIVTDAQIADAKIQDTEE